MSVEEKVCVRTLGSMMSYAASQVAKFDEDFKSKLAGLNEVIQYKVGDDIFFHTIIKDQEITGFEGEASNPTLTFEIEEVSKALKLFTGQIDAGELLSVVKFSDPNKAASLSFIMETVGKYAEGMGGR